MATPSNYDMQSRRMTTHPRLDRRHSVGGPVILILLGVFLLLGNLHWLGWPTLGRYFARYWPLLLIFWGLVRLIEHFAARRTGSRPPAMGAGGFLLLVLLVIAGLSVAHLDQVHWGEIDGNSKIFGDIDLGEGEVLNGVFGQDYTFSQELEQAIPPDGSLRVNSDRGAVTVLTWDQDRIRVLVSKRVRAESQPEAAKSDSATQAKLSGSANELTLDANTHGAGGVPVQSDLQIFLPAKVAVTIAARGDIVVRSRQAGVSVSNARGSVTLEDIGGDASLVVRRGNVAVSKLTGDLAIDGGANEVTVSDVGGSVRMNGGAYDAMRLSRIAHGLSYESSRTTIRLAKLDGELRLDHGDLSGTALGGPTQLTTRSKDVRLENVSGDLDIENSNGSINIRVTRLPLGAINIVNRHADIHLTLPAKAVFQVKAHTRHGDIRSDFDLNLQSSHGESAATGSIGSGGPTLQIETDYGDIAIAKA